MAAKAVSEISSGAQFSRSSNEGQLADTATRVFRILMEGVGQPVNAQKECGVSIGDEHPVSLGTYCTSFDLRYDGDSRMVYLVTFQYQSTPSSAGEDPKSQPPDVRPADWSISSSLIEVPVYTWQPMFPGGDPDGNPVVPRNAAGDRFDPIAKYEPMVTISVKHFESSDPTTNAERVGVINEVDFEIGTLSCRRHTLMLRGISSEPVAEFWNDRLYRGWIATYEFAYRRNHVKGLCITEDQNVGAGEKGIVVDADIGWDVAVPQTGFNVIAFNPANAAVTKDIFGQPLKHRDGKIVEPPQLPDGVNAGDRVRAMVKVFEYENGGASQSPSAQPIPLNMNGTPRRSFGPQAVDPPVIIKRYSIYDEYDFKNLGIRGIG
jgi:hypothetical protein